MTFKIVMDNHSTKECMLTVTSVFAVLSLMNIWLNTSNRFAYSKRKVLFAT